MRRVRARAPVSILPTIGGAGSEDYYSPSCPMFACCSLRGKLASLGGPPRSAQVERRSAVLQGSNSIFDATC
jgi:hypothetical protein